VPIAFGKAGFSPNALDLAVAFFFEKSARRVFYAFACTFVRGFLLNSSGSERIARSGAEGDRLKEAININKSLSCLTDVFNGLAQKQAFVPFRNSKLTYFLQNALSGDGKTMMFVNLSPTHESYFESLCSLRFANGVNKIELGKATRNVTEASAEVQKKSSTGGGKTSAKKAGDDKSPAPGKAAAKKK
jgi:kinesin family protein C1